MNADSPKSRPWQMRGIAVLAVLLAVRAAASQMAVTEEDYETREERRPSFATHGNLFLKNATLLTVTQGTIENGCLWIRDGKIAAIGRSLEAPADAYVLDATGLFVMPGIIDCHSHIAIDGDVNEGTESIVPEVRIGDVIDHTDDSIYRALAGGTTMVHALHGSANTIGGQNAIAKLRYLKTAKEMLLKDAPRTVKFALGENPKQSNFTQREGRRRYPATRMGVEAVLRRAFTRAREYQAEWKEYDARASRGEEALAPRRDLRLDALVDILEGRILVHSHCYRHDEILMLLRVAEDFGFRIGTLQHVLEGYMVAPEIKAHGAACSTFSDWWAYKMEAYEAIPHNASLLTLAGISTSVNSDSGDLIRRLYHEAAKSLRYGNLSESETLALVTLNPAQQLHLQQRMGSLEVGKDGDLALFNGHPLSVYSRCEYTFIEGECYFERRRDKVLNSTGPAFGPIPIPDPSLLPVPGDGGIYAITNATLVPITSGWIENATLLIEAGVIRALGRDVEIPERAERIDGSGLFVYPGLFDAATSLGLGEIGAVSATNDAREIGGSQADLRVAACLNATSAHIPVARCDGITQALVLPSGQGISGRAALVQLDGWTWEEMTVADGVALCLRFPSVAEDSAPEKILEENQEILDLGAELERARRHFAARQQAERAPASDLGLEALAPYALGQKRVIITADRKNQIRVAVMFAEKYSLDYLLLGVTDGWKVTEFLKQHNTRCLVGPVLTTPRSSQERYDAPFQNPARLFAAGIPFALVSQDQENVRQLGHHAGMAAAFGLPKDEALKAITLAPAELLGVADRYGSLEAGKVANVIVTDGDPLELRTHVRYEFIAGKPVRLVSKHTELYERYKKRILLLRSEPASTVGGTVGGGATR